MLSSAVIPTGKECELFHFHATQRDCGNFQLAFVQEKPLFLGIGHFKRGQVRKLRLVSLWQAY